MSDPLAKFRKEPITSRAVSPDAHSGLKPYQAFDGKDRVERLQIRRAFGPTHSPSYGYLLDISYDGDYGTNFVLTYSFAMMVQVRGRNLQPVVSAIEQGFCRFIQQFDPDEHALPADDQPLIEKLDVVVKASADAIREGNELSNGPEPEI
jgi:hypothetical protein